MEPSGSMILLFYYSIILSLQLDLFQASKGIKFPKQMLIYHYRPFV